MRKTFYSVICSVIIMLTAFSLLSALVIAEQTEENAQEVTDSFREVRLGSTTESMPQGVYIAASVISGGELYEQASAITHGRDFTLYDIYILNTDGSPYNTGDESIFKIFLPLTDGYEQDFCEVYLLNADDGSSLECSVEYEEGCVVLKNGTSGVYVLVDAGAPVIVGDLQLGDIDMDEKISASDARLALRLAVGLNDNLSDTAKKCADVDEDGKVTSADARHILRYSVGLI